MHTESNRKHPLMMVQGYTFARTKRRDRDDRYWHCNSKQTTGCTAKVRFSEGGAVVFQDLKHNHQPPKYYRLPNGKYIKPPKYFRTQDGNYVKVQGVSKGSNYVS
ncbi:hypothetical protein ABMA28_001413 [Loxostege sticticalis]|uniref:FLYWCH-type domain-containing protein n=1 Tax=Loxostege sticticalis TaxID=481309 RepID=A0ABD0T1L4_LOXSC